MKARVLLVEDDKTLRTAVADALAHAGHEVTLAVDGERAHETLLTSRFDCVVLDLMLPRRNGLDVLRELRARHDRVPVLILTARGDESDKVLGFELGADDYLTKPFGVRELLARVMALLRRTEPRPERAFMIGTARVDLEAYMVEDRGATLALSRKEAAMLALLWEARGKAVSRDTFLREVWGGVLSVGDRAIDTHVLNLRKKLGTEHLLTVHGVGYRLVP